MSTLDADIARIARSPVLLVASDFDGTLSPIVERFGEATVDRRAVDALKALASLPATHVAVISGRSLADLQGRLPGVEKAGWLIFGGHGSQWGGAVNGEAQVRSELLGAAVDAANAEAAALAGAAVEYKPTGVAFHYRAAEEGPALAAAARLEQTATRLGLTPLRGHKVLELCAVAPSKDRALDAARYVFGAHDVLFVGDDVTDEAAFGTLAEHDLGVKVGSGKTAARHRVDTQAAVGPMLESLLECRRAFLAERALHPIDHYSLLSDQRTVALVDPRGTVSWLCLPRIDSPPLFASLLGDGRHGEFRIEPEVPAAAPQTAYVGDSFVLKTKYPGLEITDYLDVGGGLAFQRSGRSNLVRIVEGTVPAKVVFSPRLDFGRQLTALRVRPDGIEVDGWPDPISLRSPGVSWTIRESGGHQSAEALVDPRRGPIVLELRYGTASMRPPEFDARQRCLQAQRFWEGWTATLRIPPLEPSLVRRSALAIKALCHGPSGAIAAAATTSLPESLGGVRNWDYRFCWPRDACLAAASLVRLGNTGVALRLLDWLVGVIEEKDPADRLRPLYTVSGGHLGSEAEISELPGYGESRPVRVGNAAALQVQLDVFGPIVDLVAMIAAEGAPVTPEHWRLVEAVVAAVESRWQEPDHGIWEIRAAKRHHVHTKTMCWLAVDRAGLVAERAVGVARPMWSELADRIRADVLAHGFREDVGAFTISYGESALDAAALAVGLSGLVPAGDPRFVSTVRAVERSLRDGPVVHRYKQEDGLPGREGGWPICAGWLIESLWMIGERDRARDLFVRLAALAGPTGLLAEQFEPHHQIALGNFPQAYSHLAIINAAVRLSEGIQEHDSSPLAAAI